MRMKVKVFTKNSNGKIEFTEQELQSLFDEIYKDGFSDGMKANSYSPHYNYRQYPHLTTAPFTTNASPLNLSNDLERKFTLEENEKNEID